jgi:hypothetical protein
MTLLRLGFQVVMTLIHPAGDNAVESFLARHGSQIQGTLSGFDRLRFVGQMRLLSFVDGLAGFLSRAGVLLKDFGEYVEDLSNQIKRATIRIAQSTPTGRVHYLASSEQSKEAFVRRLPPPRDETGLVAVLSCVEPCNSFLIRRDRASKRLELRSARRKCLHYYFYLVHPRFGPMHVRLQTWLPQKVHVCLNGRDWLARQLDAQGVGYLKKDNAFVAVDDFPRAQALLDEQLKAAWPLALDALVQEFHPVHADRFGSNAPRPYYWTVEQSEWATDVIFKSPGALAELYPRLLHHGITTFGSRDVLKFLQQKVPAQGGVHGRFAGEVVSDLKSRPEGVRIKHSSGQNSVKMYDKQGQVLRVETTIHDARGMKVYRPVADDPEGPCRWQPLRKGIADLHRRCELSQAANERYLEALGAVESSTPLEELGAAICRPVFKDGRRYRGLNPLHEEDAQVLEAIQQGAHLIGGFRNRDIRQSLFGDRPADEKEHRQQSNKVGRLLALLRAHGLIRKVPRTHRYQLTTSGRTKVAAIYAARKATVEQLTGAA